MQILNKNLQLIELLTDLLQESKIDIVTYEYFSMIND